jgi:hypothetical protein
MTRTALRYLPGATGLLAICFGAPLDLHALKVTAGDVLELDLPKKMQVRAGLRGIFTLNGLMTYVSYNLKINNREILLAFYLRPRPGVSKTVLQRLTHMKLKQISADFGIGNSYEFIRAAGTDTRELVGSPFKVVKLVRVWSTETSSDILSYYFELPKHRLYDACIVQFLNVWPAEGDLPADFSMDFIEGLMRENDPRAALYKALDSAIPRIIRRQN